MLLPLGLLLSMLLWLVLVLLLLDVPALVASISIVLLVVGQSGLMLLPLLGSLMGPLELRLLLVRLRLLLTLMLMGLRLLLLTLRLLMVVLRLLLLTLRLLMEVLRLLLLTPGLLLRLLRLLLLTRRLLLTCWLRRRSCSCRLPLLYLHRLHCRPFPRHLLLQHCLLSFPLLRPLLRS